MKKAVVAVDTNMAKLTLKANSARVVYSPTQGHVGQANEQLSKGQLKTTGV